MKSPERLRSEKPGLGVEPEKCQCFSSRQSRRLEKGDRLSPKAGKQWHLVSWDLWE